MGLPSPACSSASASCALMWSMAVDRGGVHGVREGQVDAHVVAHDVMAERPVPAGPRRWPRRLLCQISAASSTSPMSSARSVLRGWSSALLRKTTKRWSRSDSGCSKPTTVLCVASGSSSKAAVVLPFSLSCVFQRRATGARKPARGDDREAVDERPGELLGRVVRGRHVRRAAGAIVAGGRDAGRDLRLVERQHAGPLQDAGQEAHRVAHRRARRAARPGTSPAAGRRARPPPAAGRRS